MARRGKLSDFNHDRLFKSMGSRATRCLMDLEGWGRTLPCMNVGDHGAVELGTETGLKPRRPFEGAEPMPISGMPSLEGRG